MPQNIYEVLWLFIIYSILGWMTEVAYHTVTKGEFVNRGFLNGPYCPIYGFGVILVILILTPLKNHLFILFIGSVILTSSLEFLTGFILEKVFHNKWWDYSEVPFNIKGYICLKFSIYWGLACMFVIQILHPIIYKFVVLLPYIVGIISLILIILIFIIDFIITVATILKFNKKLFILNSMAEQIRKLSDELGENVYENVEKVMGKSEEIKENVNYTKLILSENKMEVISEYEVKKEYMEEKVLCKKKELEELQIKYKEMIEQHNANFNRLIKAFPTMKSVKQNELLQKYKEQMKKKRK